jgi:D-glycero-alpha-D-manno-heptose-7-phosphate kinase
LIVSSAPLRLSFNGGGSDLQEFFESSPGKVVSISLDRFVYVTLSLSFNARYRIAYSDLERPDSLDSIKHPIVRNCLKKYSVQEFLEITSIADVPSTGSGLGASSAFTVALINAISRFRGETKSPENVGQEACDIEINRSGSLIGMQDQFSSAFGGLNVFTFNKGGIVTREPVFHELDEAKNFLKELNSRMTLIHFPTSRSASEILKPQASRLKDDEIAFNLTQRLVDLATASVTSIRSYDFHSLGKEMTEGWKIKSELNGDVKLPFYSNICTILDDSGILGGKLLGAGSGGFFAVLTDPDKKERVKDLFKGFRLVPFQASLEGPKTLEVGNSVYSY